MISHLENLKRKDIKNQIRRKDRKVKQIPSSLGSTPNNFGMASPEKQYRG